MMITMGKILVFDLDGTIADAFDAILDILNGLADEFGYDEITEERRIKVRNVPSKELFSHFGVSTFKIPFIVDKARNELSKEIGNLKPFPNLKDTLLELKKSGYRLGILTSNSEENVSIFLKNNNLEVFDFIYSKASFFGKDKVMKGMLKEQNLRSEEVIYIGDETRDIEAARKVNIKVISVSWGFNSRQLLEKYDPDFVINRAEELIEAVEKL